MGLKQGFLLHFWGYLVRVFLHCVEISVYKKLLFILFFSKRGTTFPQNLYWRLHSTYDHKSFLFRYLVFGIGSKMEGRCAKPKLFVLSVTLEFLQEKSKNLLNNILLWTFRTFPSE